MTDDGKKAGMDSNGSHVTRAELMAHLEPMRTDIAEIKKDQKRLLVEFAKTQGAEKQEDRTDSKAVTSSLVSQSKATLIAVLLSIAAMGLNVVRLVHTLKHGG